MALVCNNTDCDTPHPGKPGDACPTCGEGRLVLGKPIKAETVLVQYEIDVFADQADLSDPVDVAVTAYQMMTAADALLPVLTVTMADGRRVDVDLQIEGDR